MICSKEDLKYYLQEDALANINRTNVPFFLYWVNILYKNEHYLALRYLRSVRYFEYAINVVRHNGVWGKFYWYWFKFQHHRLGFKYSLKINPNTVGPGLKLAHIIGGLIIGCESMGAHCIVNSGVVIGTKKGALRRPVIGDNCEFAVGSKVIGAVTIGNNAIVAPNSVVIKDVPSWTVVSGIPAKIIKVNSREGIVLGDE